LELPPLLLVPPCPLPAGRRRTCHRRGRNLRRKGRRISSGSGSPDHGPAASTDWDAGNIYSCLIAAAPTSALVAAAAAAPALAPTAARSYAAVSVDVPLGGRTGTFPGLDEVRS
jgi:hypothetical protein